MLASNWINANQRVQPIGLDIGHRWLKMVQIVSDGKHLRLVAGGRAPVDTIKLDLVEEVSIDTSRDIA